MGSRAILNTIYLSFSARLLALVAAPGKQRFYLLPCPLPPSRNVIRNLYGLIC